MLGMIRKDVGLVQERTRSKYLATTLGNALWRYATHMSVFVHSTIAFTYFRTQIWGFQPSTSSMGPLRVPSPFASEICSWQQSGL